MNTCAFCAVSFYHAETPFALIKQQLINITCNTFRHCRVRAFVGQPFTKQLYFHIAPLAQFFLQVFILSGNLLPNLHPLRKNNDLFLISVSYAVVFFGVVTQFLSPPDNSREKLCVITQITAAMETTKLNDITDKIMANVIL